MKTISVCWTVFCFHRKTMYIRIGECRAERVIVTLQLKLLQRKEKDEGKKDGIHNSIVHFRDDGSHAIL